MIRYRIFFAKYKENSCKNQYQLSTNIVNLGTVIIVEIISIRAYNDGSKIDY